MDTVVLESVTKVFRHRPALFNWMGRERRGETRALDGVSLSAKAGEILVILGPNGSGKTTLLKLISTILLPNSGRVVVGGSDTAADGRAVRRAVGFGVAAERSFFPRLTARENLDFFATLDDVARGERPERIESVLQAVDLVEAGDTLVMKFSSGMYQRLGIARALLKQPAVLLLDEPSRSLDPGAAAHLWMLLRQSAARGCTVLLATHSFDEAITAGDTVVVLRRGTVAAHRRLTPDVAVADLRSFYFREVGESEPAGDLLPRGAA
ncbi:MAG: ABC transporter ATP-binding protein [Terriglobales bacterium]